MTALLSILLAFLPIITTAPAQCRPASKHALVWLAAADKASSRHDPKTANDQLDKSLAALGQAYLTPNLLDDTDMHLVIARDNQRRGRLSKAAVLKRRILIERLGLCGVKVT